LYHISPNVGDGGSLATDGIALPKDGDKADTLVTLASAILFAGILLSKLVASNLPVPVRLFANVLLIVPIVLTRC
jgi:hypothetical protein